VGWLGAAVLGANAGIVSTAALVVGVTGYCRANEFPVRITPDGLQ